MAEFHGFYEAYRDVTNAWNAFPEVDFRHLFMPSENLQSDNFKDTKYKIEAMMADGRVDAHKELTKYYELKHKTCWHDDTKCDDYVFDKEVWTKELSKKHR